MILRFMVFIYVYKNHLYQMEAFKYFIYIVINIIINAENFNFEFIIVSKISSRSKLLRNHLDLLFKKNSFKLEE